MKKKNAANEAKQKELDAKLQEQHREVAFLAVLSFRIVFAALKAADSNVFLTQLMINVRCCTFTF